MVKGWLVTLNCNNVVHYGIAGKVRICCSIQTHSQSLDSTMANSKTLCIMMFFSLSSFVLVNWLTVLLHASYHATMYYVYMNECHHVYHLDFINKCMYIFVDKPNESFH